MAIIILDGANADLLGDTLRNQQISQGNGALLVKASQKGAAVHQLEKIADGVAIQPGTNAADIAWKRNSLVIIDAKQEAILDKFEAIAPGFAKLFGPVTRMDTGALPK